MPAKDNFFRNKIDDTSYSGAESTFSDFDPIIRGVGVDYTHYIAFVSPDKIQWLRPWVIKTDDISGEKNHET